MTSENETPVSVRNTRLKPRNDQPELLPPENDPHVLASTVLQADLEVRRLGYLNEVDRLTQEITARQYRVQDFQNAVAMIDAATRILPPTKETPNESQQ